ncbi:ribosome quality control complex subunit NEMF homolog isoform X2 [Anopheles ziemanni]|uniref:ribosome quality control complex subunit NEMF homolog isoform X2 n=1 Tax=Anopheles coustani TaxID=139045 RepID=UPI00265B40D9|nr:ribosome quality control complex subunit NEMF homolog isoform X2 [Anopheles coustani]XP_058175364.1 ribosome quality control complex subunit NEMF homolog isoform X2 [Anopheles ziemanni]
MTKTRFNTYDVVCSVTELQKLIGMRVNQIYDIDNKTYLIRLARNEEKVVLLLESGLRFHTTSFEWPKNMAPSGFTMKLRKHLKNKRLESLQQLGVDRIVDFQFGSGEAAYHIVLELYDRGNILLTDCDLRILNILRPHVEGEELRFAVREKYPRDRAKQDNGPPSMEQIKDAIQKAHPGDTLRTALNPVLEYGASVIDHVLHKHGLFGSRIGGEIPNDPALPKKVKKKQKNLAKEFSKVFDMETDLASLMSAINDAESMLRAAQKEPSPGYIIQKKELKPAKEGEKEEYYFTNLEYQPYLYNQYQAEPYKQFDSFTTAVDEFYSSLESQKIDLKAFAQEREALKKLSNVKTDHAKRIEELTKVQLGDRKKAELITRNQDLVDKALLAIQSALASQMSWTDIQDLVKAAQANKDPVASCIRQLKLEINHISLYLADPYAFLDEGNSDEDEEASDREDDEEKLEPMVVDVDLALTAFANARRYYDQRRFAARKEQKTIESSSKALKNAERKTIQTLKDVRTQTTISKVRKVYWFEKFYWFVSSENYLVIGGRDQQQNELIVKRYMRPTDIYVHAEIQGASSVIIKNPAGGEIPPKTLLEAGTMAISYSVAWDAKVVTSAYWVRSEQVSKTAPTGEYLTTGSFMIRGRKNFLPPCHLVLGLSFLFKLEDSSVERHRGERRVRTFEEESVASKDEVKSEISDQPVDQEIELDEDGAEEEPEKDSGVPQFPDTHVKVEHDTGKVSVKADPILQRLTSAPDADSVVFLGDEKPYIIQPSAPRIKQISKSKQKAKDKEQKAKQKQAPAPKEEPQKAGQLKRGQRAKMRKIKEKYKDQDDDDRKLIMEILKSAGNRKPDEETKEDDDAAADKGKASFSKRTPRLKPGEFEELGDDTPAAADLDMLDGLTGQPVDEDELLFAIPVVAPYQSLHNYKYKVKLTPGTGKRGKASKMALQIFLKDKQCSPREKDLLKAVKDEVLARNIPGKVKLSAPQMQKVRK